MAHKQRVVLEAMRCLKLQGVIVVASLLSFALLFGGCESNGGKAGQIKGEIAKTPAEQKKEELLKEIDRKFENPRAHYELGQLYQADSLWSQAEHEYNVTLSFKPLYRKAQAALVKVLIGGGDSAKAQIYADIYTAQVANSAPEALKLGLAFQEQGLDEYAMSCYKEAIQLAPNSAKINRQIGYYYLRKGDRASAKAYLSRSFQLDPLQPDVAGELGRLGVVVTVPRKTTSDTKQLDRMVEQADKQHEPEPEP
jgi:tetratricopeptide (TPR) repeat protein